MSNKQTPRVQSDKSTPSTPRAQNGNGSGKSSRGSEAPVSFSRKG